MPHDPVNDSDDLRIDGLAPEAIRAQLFRMLKSGPFANAPGLGRLLEYLVERTLDGAAASLKEYALGVDVFGRGETFDPRTDTIVRVQMKRLRAKLGHYYSTDGRLDPLVITVPTGRYTPAVRARTVSSPTACQQATGALPPGGREIAGRGPSAPWELPASRTPLVGRSRELEALGRRLRADGARLLTITGAGGSGKTRLAYEVAREVSDEFPGGVLALQLAPIGDPALVSLAIAQALGLRHASAEPLVDALVRHVRQSIVQPTLFVLDNFEHVLPAAPMVAELLDASPRLTCLVTSRAALRVYGEEEYPISPLPVPEVKAPPAELRRSAAVRLFAQRARASTPHFRLTDDNVVAVAAICRKLDGLPLALELAAARVKLFPLKALLDRLDRSLEFLTDGPRDLPMRQRTLRSTIDWSYALLPSSEQKLFRRMAVFVGGCTLEGVEAVCAAAGDLGNDLEAGVTSLVDRNLVHVEAPWREESRFNMLATVREYALERLAASGDEELARRAHAAYCMVLAEEGNPRLSIEAREAWLSRCDLERDNHRAAFDWLVAVGQAEWAARLGLALFGYWERRQQLDEGRQRLLSVLDMPVRVPPGQRARIMSFAAALCHNRGDYAAGLELHREALQIFRTIGDKVGEAAELNSLAAHARITGDYEEARIYCEQTLELCRALGGEPETAAALSNLADVVSRLGDHTAARQLIDEALVIFKRQGDEAGVCQSISYLADFARRSGDSAEARQLHRRALEGFVRIGDAWGVARSAEDLAHLTAAGGDRQAAYRLFTRALAIFHQLDHRRGIGRVLEGLALLAQEELEFQRALTLAGAAFAIRQTFGVPPRPAERAAFERALAPTWRSCPARAARTAWTAGTIMSEDQAVGFASRSAGRPQDEKFTGSRMRRTAATRSTGTFARRPCSRMSRSSGEK